MSDILLVEEFSRKQLPLAPFSQLNESEKLQVIEYLKEEERKLLLVVEQEGDDSEKAEKGRSELSKKISYWAHTATDLIELLLTFFGGQAGATAAGVLSGIQCIAYFLERGSLREDEGLSIPFLGINWSAKELNTINIFFSGVGAIPVIGQLLKSIKTPLFFSLRTAKVAGKMPQLSSQTVKGVNYVAKNGRYIKDFLIKSLNKIKSLLSKSMFGRLIAKRLPIDKVTKEVSKGVDNMVDLSERIVKVYRNPATGKFVKAGTPGAVEVTRKVGRKAAGTFAKVSTDDIAKAAAKASKEGIEAVPEGLVNTAFKGTLAGITIPRKVEGLYNALRYLLIGNKKTFWGIGYKLAIHSISFYLGGWVLFGRLIFRALRKQKTLYILYQGKIVPTTIDTARPFLSRFFKAKGVKNADDIVKAAEATTAQASKEALKNVPKIVSSKKLNVIFKPMPAGLVQASRFAPAILLLKDMYKLLLDDGILNQDTLVVLTDDAEEANNKLANAPQNVIDTQTTDEAVVSSNRINLEKANFSHQQGFNYIYDCDKMQVEKIDKLTGKAIAIYKKNSRGWWAWTQTGSLVSRSMNSEINRIAAMCSNKQNIPTNTIKPITKPIQTVEPMKVPITRNMPQADTISAEPQIQVPSLEPTQLSPEQRIQQARENRRTARKQARQSIRQARQDRRADRRAVRDN